MSERYVKLEDAQSVVFNILKEAAVNSDGDETLSVLAHCSAEIFLELFAISNTEESPTMKETKIVRYWNEDLQRPGKPHKIIEIW